MNKEGRKKRVENKRRKKNRGKRLETHIFFGYAVVYCCVNNMHKVNIIPPGSLAIQKLYTPVVINVNVTLQQTVRILSNITYDIQYT